MILKRIIGFVLLSFMSVSMWNKLEDSVSGVQEPMATAAVIIILILMIVVFVIRVIRD